MAKSSRIFFLFNGRFPGEKASALFAAKSADAFLELGREAIVLAPRRLGRSKLSAEVYYHLSRDIKTVYLPTIDLFFIPFFSFVAFRLNLLVFSISALFYCIRKARKDDWIYSDQAFPILLSSYVFKNTAYEVHDFPERAFWFYKMLFARARVIIATNEWKKRTLVETFGVPEQKIIVELNAVDLSPYEKEISKESARARLDLPQGSKIVVYTGHLYSWKGVDTLALATKLLSDALVYLVGGTQSDIARFKSKYRDTSNLVVVGQRPHEEMVLWQKAADVLVLPNTAKESISAHYTSPMKLFEYMASGTPIVASDLPSVRAIVTGGEVVFVKPDDAHALSEGINIALSDSLRSVAAKEKIRHHTWNKRAERILIHLG